MSSEKYTEEIRANIERADRAVEAAKQLLSGGYSDFAASRAYYAVFYAATGLLLKEKLTFRKHSGVIATIHKNFIKPGRLEKHHGRNLNWLFELRSVGDYGVTLHVPLADARWRGGCQNLNCELKKKSSGFRVHGSRFTVHSSGTRVQAKHQK